MNIVHNLLFTVKNQNNFTLSDSVITASDLKDSKIPN